MIHFDYKLLKTQIFYYLVLTLSTVFTSQSWNRKASLNLYNLDEIYFIGVSFFPTDREENAAHAASDRRMRSGQLELKLNVHISKG